MEIKKYIIDNLKEIKLSFSDVVFFYGYEDSTDYHIVEVYPEHIKKSRDFILLKLDLIKKFNALFPNDNLLISSVDKYNDLDDDNMIYVSDNEIKRSSILNGEIPLVISFENDKDKNIEVTATCANSIYFFNVKESHSFDFSQVFSQDNKYSKRAV